MTFITYPRAGRPSRAWFALGAAVFVVLVFLGIAMSLTQSGSSFGLSAQNFYASMTLHGIGMPGTLFTISIIELVVLVRLLPERVEVPPWITGASFWLAVFGVVGLVAATLIGKFAPGWYLLYPLVFVNATWESWATGLGLGSVLAFGVAWLLLQGALLWRIFRTYGLVRMFAWQYILPLRVLRRIGGRPVIENESTTKTPFLILGASVCLVDGIIATLFGAVFLALNLAQCYDPSLAFDPLMMKNIVFIFGHTFVNIGMYMAVVGYYAISPLYSGRAWETNRIVAIAWNAVLVIVLVAYPHHVYMDFVQPHAFHYLGMAASYATMFPLLVVTMIGGIKQVYYAGMRRWRFVPMAFSWGLVWWIIGGVPAVVDATPPFNGVFHNTLWVPAHFHTYALMGYGFFLLGAAWHFFGSERAERLAKWALWVMIAGGALFVLALYMGGWWGVPRRYALYDAIPMHDIASVLAAVRVFGGGVFVGGFLTLMFTFAYARKR